MAKIRWTTEAEQWLKAIFDYIAEDNPETGFRTLDAIYEKVQILQDFPEIGYRYHQHPERNIRILLYDHYRIAYLVKPNKDIDILGVFHGALDIDRYLP